MQAFHYPNIRSMFVPDPGYTFFDIDLDSADLRIVTWESDCKEIKSWFAEGKKPYVELMKEYYRDPSISVAACKVPGSKEAKLYASFKSLCHGTNYLGTAAGVAPRVGLLVHEVERIQRWYFGRCPEIKQWQTRVIAQVDARRRVVNAWGYHLHIFNRVEEATYREVIAWIPQSTVGILINHAYVNIDKNLPKVQVLLQVHDSLAGQFPTVGGDGHRDAILQQARVPIPYADPLIIPVGIKTSTKSWGDCG